MVAGLGWLRTTALTGARISGSMLHVGEEFGSSKLLLILCHSENYLNQLRHKISFSFIHYYNVLLGLEQKYL